MIQVDLILCFSYIDAAKPNAGVIAIRLILLAVVNEAERTILMTVVIAILVV